MARKPKLSKPPKPDELNGDHDRGFEIYKMLWGLQGRIGRLEGTMLLLTGLLIALAVKEFA